MPDITMCTNKECPLKSVCKRVTATPNPIMQSYDKFTPFRNQDDGTWDCDKYLKTEHVRILIERRYG